MIGILGKRKDKNTPNFNFWKVLEKTSIGKTSKELSNNGRMNVSNILAEKQLRNDDTNTMMKRYSTVTVRLKKNSFLFRLKSHVENTISIPQIA